jgi:hypothetical protein
MIENYKDRLPTPTGDNESGRAVQRVSCLPSLKHWARRTETYSKQRSAPFFLVRWDRKIVKSDYQLRHIRPSAHIEQLGSRWTDFHEI